MSRGRSSCGATILAGLGLDGWDGALERVIAATRGRATRRPSCRPRTTSSPARDARRSAGRAIAGRIDMAERAQDLRLAGWERQFEAMLTNLDLHAGELSATVDRARRSSRTRSIRWRPSRWGSPDACALVDLGRFEEADAILGRLLAEAPDDAVGRCGVLHIVAEQALWGGRPTVALRRVEEYRAYGAEDHPTSHLDGRDAPVGRPSTPRSRSRRGSPSGDGEGMLVGAQLEREGIEALAGAAGCISDAAATDGSMRQPRPMPGTTVAATSERDGPPPTAAAGAASSRRLARDLEALEVEADAQGFGPLAGRIRRSLRLLGVRRSATGASTDVRPGPRLTRREREIAELVAMGLSNVEIARRLGVGRPTVARLLSSTMDKLGVDSRAQVAARIERV